MSVDTMAILALAAAVGVVAGQLLTSRRLIAIGLVGIFAAFLIVYLLTGTSNPPEPVSPPGPPAFV